MTDASDGFDPRQWLSTITYAEIHSLVIGAGILFLAALADSAAFFFVFIAILYGVFRLGGTDGEDDDGEEESPVQLRQKYMDQIGREFHYYLGGGLAGERIGAYAFYRVHDHWPTYYEEIPEVVETLFGGLI